jgi:hypothetical protein
MMNLTMACVESFCKRLGLRAPILLVPIAGASALVIDRGDAGLRAGSLWSAAHATSRNPGTGLARIIRSPSNVVASERV